MAIIKQGGSDPYQGKVMTTMGYKGPRPPLCRVCGERREGQLYTINVNGQEVCADCASPHDAPILKGTCDPESCPCGEPCDDTPEPAA